MASWGYQPPASAPAYGSTGYQANPQITVEDVIVNCAKTCIDDELARRNISVDAAGYMFERVQAELGNLTNWANTYLRHGNNINTDDVKDWLYKEPLLMYFNEWNQMRAPQHSWSGGNVNNSGFRSPMQPTYSPNAYQSNGMRPLSTAEIAASKGIGKILQPKQMPIPKQYVPNEDIQNQPQQSSAYCNPKVMEPLIKVLLKGRPNLTDRQNTKPAVDKITSNTGSLLYNDEFIETTLTSPQTELTQIIGSIGTNSNLAQAEVIQDVTPECEVTCTISSQQTVTCAGESIDLKSIEVVNPVNTAEEAIEYVKDAVQDFGKQENWVASIEYNEICTKKLPSNGPEVKKVFLSISSKLNSIENLQDVSKQIIPILSKTSEPVRDYLTTLIIDKINKLFRISLFLPDQPQIYPKIDTWSTLFVMVREENRKESPYIEAMFRAFGEEYPQLIFHCVKKALFDIFNPESDTIIVTTEREDRGILARADNLIVHAGKYHVSDYGVMADGFWKTISEEINRDYIIHKYRQLIMVTNMAVKQQLGSTSRYTIIKGLQTTMQYVIGSVLEAIKYSKQNPEDITLIEYNKEGTAIVGIYSIGQCLNNDLLITKM